MVAMTKELIAYALSRHQGQAMTTTLPDGLLPCPFCGGQAQVIRSESDDPKYSRPHFIVRCPSVIGAFVSDCYGNYTNLWDITPKNAEERWNRRACIAANAAAETTPPPAPNVSDAEVEAVCALTRYFVSGPEGSFQTDDLTLANKLISRNADIDADEWTITDTVIAAALARAGS